jgi:hypothetical protein
MARVFPLLLMLALPAALPAQFHTRLSPATVRAFDDYVKDAEAGLDWRARYAQLPAGPVRVEAARGDGSIDIKDGIVHDWVSATLVRGASVGDALAVLQDYPSYKKLYAPQVTDSRLLSRDGGRFRIYLQMMKKKVLTVVLNGEFEVLYSPLGGNRWNMVSRSTRLAEVDPDANRELPAGTGRGFLWRLNAYWVIEPRPEGVYLECRSISLSRDVPFGLGLVLGPFVTSVPPESLRDTMEATTRALRSLATMRAAAENPGFTQQEGGH